MRRLFLLLVLAALLVGLAGGFLGSRELFPQAATGATATPPATADEYLRNTLEQRGLRDVTFQSVARPIVGSRGTIVYLYRVDAKNTDGKPAEAFVGVTLYEGKAVNSLSVSNTGPELGGMIELE